MGVVTLFGWWLPEPNTIACLLSSCVCPLPLPVCAESGRGGKRKADSSGMPSAKRSKDVTA